MTRYCYHGPVSGVTLRHSSGASAPAGHPAEGEETEVMLLPGQVVELPSDHPHVVVLVARGLLVADTSSSVADGEAR